MATARFGRPIVGGDLTFRFEARQMIALTDRERKKFFGGEFQRAMRAAHTTAAEIAAEGMVDKLDAEVAATGRTQDSRKGQGERLRDVLVDARNFDITASGFAVGRPAWLDESPAAKYWRQIEQGNPNSYLTQGGALFTNDFSSWHMPSTDRTHARMPQMFKLGRVGLRAGRPLGPTFWYGPFPEYRYSRGAGQAMRRLDMIAVYRKVLDPIGIDVSKQLR